DPRIVYCVGNVLLGDKDLVALCDGVQWGNPQHMRSVVHHICRGLPRHDLTEYTRVRHPTSRPRLVAVHASPAMVSAPAFASLSFSSSVACWMSVRSSESDISASGLSDSTVTDSSSSGADLRSVLVTVTEPSGVISAR